MKYYVGVTDYSWFEFLKSNQCDEVNFWTPSGRSFKAINPNEMFLFKLHSPNNYVVGGGFFVQFSLLPTFMAWNAFEIENGTNSLQELNKKIDRYRAGSSLHGENNLIGCIILTDVFYFDETDWIPIPEDWKGNIVSGKTYSTENEYGRHLYDEIQERLLRKGNPPAATLSPIPVDEAGSRYSIGSAKHRIGQGTFRVQVTDAYQRRCAITGEKTLPVLEAAHIKSFSENGPNTINNGILLRSDFHKLYDDGYITITPDYRISVSKRLHEDFDNGKIYYAYQDKPLLVLPDTQNMPDKNFLEWHYETVFLR